MGLAMLQQSKRQNVVERGVFKHSYDSSLTDQINILCFEKKGNNAEAMISI